MKFEDIFIDDTKNVTRIDSNKFGESGNIAIVDQGKKLIVGYTNNDNYKVCTEERIIFGDHTRNFKYINIPFICGADGTKVLKIINPSKTSYKYMYYYLLASYIPNTGYNRHFKWVKQLKFNIHDYQMQINIVKKLDSITKLISLKENQIIKLDNLVKSQFVEMFGDPIINDRNFEFEEIGKISQIITGTTPDTKDKDNWNGNINWVTPAELSDNSFIVYDTVRKITEKGKKSKSLTLMPAGTVIFSTRAPIGKTAIAGVEMCCNQGFKNCICSDKVNNIYLFYVFKNNTNYFNSLGSGATFKEISKSVFEKIKISVPPIEIQKKFAEFVKQNDKQKFEFEKQLKKLEELQSSLMQEYFG